MVVKLEKDKKEVNDRMLQILSDLSEQNKERLSLMREALK